MKFLRIALFIVPGVVAGPEINANTQTVTNLYSFASVSTDGYYPQAGLVQSGDGSFYGTTQVGGASDKGTVFRISPSGSDTNLHSFAGASTDGAYPQAGLVQDSDGNFYGTAQIGGANDNGTVFRINPSGSYSNLYSFGDYPDA